MSRYKLVEEEVYLPGIGLVKQFREKRGVMGGVKDLIEMGEVRVNSPSFKDIVSPDRPLEYTPPAPRATNSFEVDVDYPSPSGLTPFQRWWIRLPTPLFRAILNLLIWWEGLTWKR